MTDISVAHAGRSSPDLGAAGQFYPPTVGDRRHSEHQDPPPFVSGEGATNACGLAPWQLRRVLAVVEAHLDQRLTISQLANECRLSIGHFSRAFRQSCGAPPHQWLVQRRIEHAKSLLANSDESLVDIAMCCGFVDQSHLTRVFTRLERVSPGRWRRLNMDASRWEKRHAR